MYTVDYKPRLQKYLDKEMEVVKSLNLEEICIS